MRRSTAVSGSRNSRRRPAEPQLEVAQAPADLGPPVACRGERQDRVVVCLRDRIVAVVLGDPGRVQLGLLPAHPRGQRRPEVPPDQRAPFRALGVGLVRLAGDARVPVGERRGAISLGGHATRPVNLAGGLVEVAVDGQCAAAHREIAFLDCEVARLYRRKAHPERSRPPAGRRTGQRRCRLLPW